MNISSKDKEYISENDQLRTRARWFKSNNNDAVSICDVKLPHKETHFKKLTNKLVKIHDSFAKENVFLYNNDLIHKKAKDNEIKEPRSSKTSIKKYADSNMISKKNNTTCTSAQQNTNPNLNFLKSKMKFDWAFRKQHVNYRELLKKHENEAKNMKYQSKQSQEESNVASDKKHTKDDAKIKRDFVDILDSDPYNVLEISPGASQEYVKKIYKERLLKIHPDKGGSIEDFLRLKAAYEILVDEE